jgi:translation initiation factor IF-2
MLKLGRVHRQLLAVGALSLALLAIVLGLGGLAVSSLGTTPAVGYAAGTASGVYRVVTPTPAPFATPQPSARKTSVTAPVPAAVAFRPVVAAPRPAATSPRVRPRTAKASTRKAAEAKPPKRQRRRPVRAPKPAPRPTAAAASIPASPSATRGDSGKPKVTGPRPHAAGPKPARGPARPHVRPAAKPKPLLPAAPAPANPGHGGPPPGQTAQKAHGKGR